jgi:adenylosuccinate synthase
LLKQVILLSGQVCAGKTTLHDNLVARFGFRVLKTKEVISRLAPAIERERGAMQDYGEYLDRRTKGGWVRDALIHLAEEQNEDVTVVVDAVRILNQIDSIRRAFGPRVFHIHLTAPLDILEARYKQRQVEGFKEFATYREVMENKTERKVRKLAVVADVVINTGHSTQADVVTRAASHLGLYGRENARLVDVLVGGQYGSEGKGHVASYLAREYDILVRVGGPNAGHKVFEEPKPFTFHQLPSGTRSSEAKLVIGPGANISVARLAAEIAACQIDKDRLSIDPRAMIIEKSDIRNEKRGLVNNISSTGQGVGYATSRRIIHRGENSLRMAKDVAEFRPFIRDTYEELEKAFSEGKKVFLEGTQGTGLSLYHGIYPYVTSRDTTVAGCLAEAGISPGRVRKVIMVCRTYPIRVADPDVKGKTSGFMSQPLDWDEIARRAGLDVDQLRGAERTSTTDRKRRVAEFDWQLLRKAAFLNSPTDIALTFADYLSKDNMIAKRFDQLNDDTIRFIQEVERVALAPVTLISTGFNSRSIIDRRSW